MKRQRSKILIGLLAIIPLLLFAYSGMTSNNQSTKQLSTNVAANKNEDVHIKDQEDVQATKTELTLSHEKIVEKTSAFMDILVQETDQQYKVKGMSTKQALIKAFNDVASSEVAKKYVDVYYNEKDDGLYIVPTELPPWFVADQDYQKEKISDNKYRIQQSNQSDLYGNYEIELELSYVQQKWKITSVNYNYQNDDTIDSNQAI
ncbi:hypothetical protein Pryu01_02801 [Paraliobacillus ryukyuensis]|uniref:Uncharacterized protein n=1 Tax=Paraliobacillus ryukyuensis TaxID=200904 RepID=A0A366E6W1_9BACI|nr:hypothetical protein [Paraliobacillus ryukyuensis]RBO98131.1 hypothetical protein DES48_106154 [Paraliobacillus ryukyuensis]